MFRVEGAKSTPILEDIGTYHLYRINPDGTGRKLITKGKDHDLYPKWSPNGKYIAFIRRTDFETRSETVGVMSADGGKVISLGKFKGLTPWLLWSPDSRKIAVLPDLEGVDEDPSICIIDTQTKQITQLPKVVDIAWSPNGHYLYMRRFDNSAVVQEVQSKRSFPVVHSVRLPVWLDNDRFIGARVQYRKGIKRSYELNWLCIISKAGKLLRHIALQEEQGSEEFRRLRRHPSLTSILVLETAHQMSDGWHWSVSEINWTTGATNRIVDGRLLGLSVKGDRYIL